MVGFGRAELATCLAHERAQEQAAAHSDAAVDAPDGERNARRLERFLPRDDVLVDAVEQRPVQVEKHRRAVRVDVCRGLAGPGRGPHSLTVDSLHVTPSIRLGRLFGIEIGANWSLVFIFALVTWTVATAVLPIAVPGQGPLVHWLTAVVGAVLFYVCLLAHEFSHALVARSHGVKVEGITLWLSAVCRSSKANPRVRARRRSSQALDR